MSTRPIIARTLVTLAAAIAFAALAGTAVAAPRAKAPNAYASGVRVAGKQVSASLQGLVTTLGISLQFPVAPTAGKQCGAILTKAESRLATAQKELAALKPPAAAKAANKQLLAGTIALQVQLRPLIVRLENGYLVDAAKLLKLPAIKTIESASASLRAAGYPTGI
jgi:hypothetical protein